MNENFQETICRATGASDIFEIEVIQSLWSGYGKIARYGLENSELNRVVVKHVRLPDGGNHPRGWNTNLSHERKLKSYQVETAWYEKWSHLCDENCRIPKCLALDTHEDEVLMVLEDLDDSGFSNRVETASWNEIEACIIWLANFHATYLGCKADDLWDIGTYWHLDTRPDELLELSDIDLKNAASLIDAKLNDAKFQTFVHGDAKLANFCFSPDGKSVAAVDFQYVGGGCGMKDVAYFVGSCLYEEDCERLEDQILTLYFNTLRKALKDQNKPFNADEVEREWRALYHVAWADFHRFLKGWSPDHWKINNYSELLVRKVVTGLETST